MRASRGFSLVELLVVVAIIAILAAVALPSYRSYVIRTNRTVAKTVLVEAAQRQESYFSDHKRYAANLKRLGYKSDDGYITAEGVISGSATGALYKISIAATGTISSCATSGTVDKTSGQAILVATPQTLQNDSRCNVICLSTSGERGTSGSAGLSECWGR